MNWQPFRGDAPENMTIFSASFPDVSDQWPMKDDAAREIASLDRALKAEPALRPPRVEYDEGGWPCLFRRIAIPNRPSATVRRSPRGAPGWSLRAGAVCGAKPAGGPPARRHKMDSDSRQWFIHANDAIGVRPRPGAGRTGG